MSAFYIERNNQNGGLMDQGHGGNAGGMGQGTSGQSMPSPGFGGQGMNQGGMQSGAMQGGAMQGGSQGSMQNGLRGGENNGLDYRDDLRSLLDKAHAERGLTRYRLCKQMGIDSGTLSNVLAKRRHFSLEKLEQILGLLGYRLSFTPAEGGAPGAANGGQSGSMGTNGMHNA